MSFSFKKKNVVITGGSRGLGLSLAWHAVNRKASVTLIARTESDLETGRELLKRDFPDSTIYIRVCDVTDTEALRETLKETIEEMGHIDLLVNNAGSILVGPFESMEIEDFEAQMRLHLFAVVEATRAIVPHFKERKGGRILNICSLGGKVAVPHMLPYDVSKFALAGFSQGVGPELSRVGIRLTTAYPTVMRTGSPIQAVFKGNHEKEFRWFQAIDHLPFLSMSADEAARKILDGVTHGKSEIILSLPARVRMVMGVFFPETTNRLMALATRALPTENSKIRKTGADSGRAFDASVVLAPFKKSVEKARATYNQKPKHDAEFNMGLETTP